MRAFFERKARDHGVSWTYTSDRNWYAKPRMRQVWIPAPYDDESLAIALHEVAHSVLGGCPGGPLHFNRRRNGSSECLGCEIDTSRLALSWCSTPRGRERLNSALKIYRYGVPAPVAALEKADVMLGRVSALENQLKRLKFAELEARLERARRS